MHIYDEQIARHYAAYRPPLHRLILDDALSGQLYQTGLDIGCGTGYSALALADSCEQVIGVDHSQPMLEMATSHPRVTYRLGSGDNLPVGDTSVDVVTLAGALFYLNSEAVIRELYRICRADALILPYDFEVHLGDLMDLFSLVQATEDEAYDHACNLSGEAGIVTLSEISRNAKLTVTKEQATHILLSDMSRLDPLASKSGSHDPFNWVVGRLENAEWPGTLEATIYYSVHRLKR